jgi:hypothetical protein
MAKVSQGQQQQAADNNQAEQQANIATALKGAKTNITALEAAAISKQTNPGHMGATGGPYATFGGATDGTTLKSNINTTIGDLNDLAGDVANAAARINQLYDILSAAGVIT